MKSYIRPIIVTLCFFLSYSYSFAQLDFSRPLHKKNKGANISLNLGTTSQNNLKTSFFNVGLLTNIYQLKGMGINIISSVAQKDACGLQFSGLANMSGLNMKGIQLSGISNINGQDLSGITISGIINMIGNKANGLILSGGINIIGEQSNGLMIGGLINMSGNTTKGMQLSGLANITGNKTDGVSLSGLLNVSAKEMNGLQLSSLLNVNGEQIKGLQISALGNVGINVKGMQIGTANYATEVKGIQMGLLNLCEGEIKGLQIGLVNHSKDTSTVKIGLVNINPKTRIQMLVYGGNASKFNLAVRFKNKMTYTMLGVGTHYLGISNKFSGDVFYRAGIYQPICKRLQIGGDLGYSHIENFDNGNAEPPKRMYSLQARANIEYTLTKKISIFASGGYALTRYYHKNKIFEKKPIIEAGIILF